MAKKMTMKAKLMIGAVGCGSVVAFGMGAHQLQDLTSPQTLLLMSAGVIASRFKVKLPGVTGNMSGSVPIVLMAILRLHLVGTLIVAAAAAISQSYASGTNRPQPVQFLFNACTLVNASALGFMTFHSAIADQSPASRMLMLVASAAAYFLANTMPVAGIIAITEHSNPLSLWRTVFLWSFPNYVIGAGMAAIVSAFGNSVGWLPLATLIAALFAVYQCYKVYVSHSSFQPPAMAAAAGH
jgi:ABC-type dipeptide/oligopeptide/nickel transport system permease component